MIKDSGDRTSFDSGAVRDMHVGKGRCDLMPHEMLKFEYAEHVSLIKLLEYAETKHTECLYHSLVGASREMFDNIDTMFLEVAIHFEDGANKYGEYNWQKGIPEQSYIDSAIRHFLKWHRGDIDERHDRAFVWNIMCLLWTSLHRFDDCKGINNNDTRS